MLDRTRIEEMPKHEEIARCAYLLWEQDGRPHGRDKEYWCRAEQELIALHLQEERAMRHWEKSTGILFKRRRVRR
jgi:hypothetical protein